ncbi:MAG: response regulator [Ardenticatenaceae bacterium]|nr:response regulator [Anaerolineales bacterium]MCB8938293.1 response regulator [Ardenticatenaceae bacterium]MCB8975658.1 response regulator [Ardenticatenaceae bacterium]
MTANASQTVLVIEDDPVIRGILQLNLVDRGYTVLTAEDGLAGVRTAKDECPGLVLMDIRLPNITGWEATRRLKAEPSTAHIPIIALTAQSTSKDLHRCFEAGCDAFMTKPIQFSQLFTKIEMLLNRPKDSAESAAL